MPRINLLLLGRPSLTINGQQVTGLSFAKAQALLYFLALETDRAASREALATLLWPELPPAAARANLRQVLAQLKEVAPAVGDYGPLLQITPDTVQLNRAYDLNVDVQVFEERLRQVWRHAHPDSRRCAVCARRRRRALELYRGPLLDQFIVHDSASFDDWVSLRREALHDAATHALNELAAYYIDRGAARDAVTTLERLLALDPWREEACRQLMQVHAATGQRSAALRQYRRTAAMLKAELDSEPDDETTLLYRRINSGAEVHESAPTLLAADTRFPTNLPSPTTSFVGRTHELHAVCEQIQEAGERLITITGPPGIGKSRLALMVGHALRTEFDDGVWWVPLVEVRESAQLVAEIIRALGVSEAGDEARPDVLQRYLRDKLLLLVLDNCEQIEHAAPPLSALLAACPNLTILATSRVPLRIQGEREYMVPPLAMPPDGTLLPPGELEQYDAVRLFLTRVRAVGSDIALNADTAAAIVAICRRLDGLALGIELAAARVRLFSLPLLQAQLSRRLEVLVGGSRDLPRHQQTMRSAITWSYELLPPAEQRLFRRLGMFAGGWTMDSAQAVCGDADASAPVLDSLQALLDHSLVQRQPDENDTRLNMLETVREYALEQLQASDELDQAQRRYAAYFSALAVEAAPQLKGAEQRRWLNRLEAEHDNFRSVLNWTLAARQHRPAAQLVAALWWFWRLRGYFGEGRAWVERALDAAGEDMSTERAELLLAAGFFAWDAGNRAASRRFFEATRVHAEQIQQASMAADALYGLGMLDVFGGDAVQATTRLEQALALYNQQANEWGAARALQRLTRIAVDRGQVAAAEQYAGESLRRARQTANPWLVAWSLMALGNLLVQHRDAARGAVAYQECAELFIECSDSAGLAHARFGQAMAAFATGSYKESTVLLVESRRAFGELGLEEHVANARVFQGYAALFQQEVEQAREQLHECLQLCSTLDHGEGLCSSMIGLAWVILLEGSPEHAAEVLGAEQAIREGSGARLRPLSQLVYDHVCSAVHAALDGGAFVASWARGRALSRETALVRAVG